jgi:hypothetical protein
MGANHIIRTFFHAKHALGTLIFVDLVVSILKMDSLHRTDFRAPTTLIAQMDVVGAGTGKQTLNA